jgi:uroporphyrin-III C-methyltransferase
VIVVNAPDTPALPNQPRESPPSRRPHTYSRLTTALAVLALATAAYSLWRLDHTRDRVEELTRITSALEADRTLLRTELRSLEEREKHARDEIQTSLSSLDDVPRQVQELANTTEELRGRAQGPERAWSRAEAMYLLDLAQRRLTLNRDVETAIVALEAADARLASMRDASFAAVRQQIARDLQALRAVKLPDLTGITARLASLEERVYRLPVKGILAAEPHASSTEDLPRSFLPRAWALLKRTLADLIRVREVDETAGMVTKEETLLRRAHLQLLLFSARSALARHDANAYSTSLASARAWLKDFFDLREAETQSMLKELQALEPIQIDPPLPSLSASNQALQRLMPRQPAATTRGPE